METLTASSTQALNDLLAALPELFPGEQQIPLANIRPNPDNPGPPISEEEIADLVENIAARGLLNPIKTMPDPVNPLAEGAAPHPDNPALRSDGKPWAPGDFNWVILAGERRWRACGRLNWKAIPGYILNPTPGEAVEITHLDNDVRQRGWWAVWQSIECRIKADPGLTQEEVAKRLKTNRARVTRAFGVLPLLNAEARGLICANCTNQNKGKKGISESAVLWLADLGPGTGLKRGAKGSGEDTQRLWPYPAIPAETQALVGRTLKVALDQGMTEAGVKGLVGWVKGGNEPESFSHSSPPLKKGGRGVLDPEVEVSQGAVGMESYHNTPHPPLSKGERKATTPSKAQPEIPSPLGSGFEGTQGVSPVSAVRGMGQGEGDGNNQTQKAPGLLDMPPGRLQAGKQLLHFILPAGLWDIFYVGGLFKKLEIKNKFWAFVVASALVFLLGNYLLWPITYRLYTLVSPYFEKKPTVDSARSAAAMESAHQQTAPLTLPVSPEASQGKPPVYPQNQNARGEGKARPTVSPLAHANSHRALPQSKTAPVASNPNMAAWAVADSPLASDFAERFFNVSFGNWDGSMDYFRSHLTDDYSVPFLQRYFPPSAFQATEAQKIIHRFKAQTTPKLLGVTDSTDQFLVQGEASEESNLGRRPQLLWRKTVALVVTIRHVTGLGGRVEKVDETNPETAVAAKENAGSVDPAAKFVGDAAGEAAKKLLPF